MDVARFFATSHHTGRAMLTHSSSASNAIRTSVIRARYLSSSALNVQTESDQTETSLPRPRRRRPIYVAATRQHVGKTSVSLALMSGLQARFGRAHVGFIKPVGQQAVNVTESDGTLMQVDKDAALVKQHFGLDHITFHDTSPVLIPPGYTKDYVDGKITATEQRKILQDSFDRISSMSEIVLCEGTGHCAVGSIVDASNAQVSSWLGARMVLVANGGLGASFDELELNRVLCEKYGVDIAGVVINKVKQDKYEQTKEYLGKVMYSRWGVPLLGCIPDRSFLGSPALSDLERLFPGASLVSGYKHRLRHYRTADVHLVATSLNVFLKNLRKNPGRTLYVCHASRNDILLGFLMESQQRYRNDSNWEAGMVVTGCQEYPISAQVMDIVTSMPDAPPVLMTPQLTRHVMAGIYSFTPKLNMEDGHRVEMTVNHYQPYIDFDLLLDEAGSNEAGVV